jgi:hypothetical protein
MAAIVPIYVSNLPNPPIYVFILKFKEIKINLIFIVNHLISVIIFFALLIFIPISI